MMLQQQQHSSFSVIFCRRRSRVSRRSVLRYSASGSVHAKNEGHTTTGFRNSHQARGTQASGGMGEYGESALERIGRIASKFQSGKAKLIVKDLQRRVDRPLAIRNNSVKYTEQLLACTPNHWPNKWVCLLRTVMHMMKRFSSPHWLPQPEPVPYVTVPSLACVHTRY